MDYEKKYKEALTRARSMYESRDDAELAAYIFPELTESEDEQAMRIIRKRMCYDPVPISDEDRRIVEAWLEKQKERVPKNAETGTREQKPTEWSEEGEEMLEEIINHIDTTSVQRIPARPGSDIGKSWIKFLKSLRPSWKPSEEQMKALLNAEGLLRKDKFIAIASKLAELYEQLKKL